MTCGVVRPLFLSSQHEAIATFRAKFHAETREADEALSLRSIVVVGASSMSVVPTAAPPIRRHSIRIVPAFCTTELQIFSRRRDGPSGSQQRDHPPGQSPPHAGRLAGLGRMRGTLGPLGSEQEGGLGHQVLDNAPGAVFPPCCFCGAAGVFRGSLP